MDDGRNRRRPTLADQLGAKAKRRMKAQRERPAGSWSGLGLMGVVGWSVVVPTLLGTALGAWLDARPGNAHRWTLALLVLGLTLGCLNAWHWVEQEGKALRAPPGATMGDALWTAWGEGLLLGALFFGGLWWTVQRGAASGHPAAWFGGGMLLRLSSATCGFYLVGRGQWPRLLLCLLGFFMVRQLATWLARRTQAKEVDHAPQPR